jgi:hypothetical protein
MLSCTVVRVLRIKNLYPALETVGFRSAQLVPGLYKAGIELLSPRLARYNRPFPLSHPCTHRSRTAPRPHAPPSRPLNPTQRPAPLHLYPLLTSSLAYSRTPEYHDSAFLSLQGGRAGFVYGSLVRLSEEGELELDAVTPCPSLPSLLTSPLCLHAFLYLVHI